MRNVGITLCKNSLWHCNQLLIDKVAIVVECKYIVFYILSIVHRHDSFFIIIKKKWRTRFAGKQL